MNLMEAAAVIRIRPKDGSPAEFAKFRMAALVIGDHLLKRESRRLLLAAMDPKDAYLANLKEKRQQRIRDERKGWKDERNPKKT